MVTAQDIEAARRVGVDAMGTEREADARRDLVAIVDTAKREHYSERAAIRQYDGGMSRDDAERAALADIGQVEADRGEGSCR
jgi:hypothetical protein